jgi:hypothetical protein
MIGDKDGLCDYNRSLALFAIKLHKAMTEAKV